MLDFSDCIELRSFKFSWLRKKSLFCGIDVAGAMSSKLSLSLTKTNPLPFVSFVDCLNFEPLCWFDTTRGVTFVEPSQPQRPVD